MTTSEDSQHLWEVLQDWLYSADYDDGDTFSAVEVAEDMGLEVFQVSAMIQSHLGTQIRQDSDTVYFLHRVAGTRTRRAEWKVGYRKGDVVEIGEAFYDDIINRLQCVIQPSLARIARTNPRVAKTANAKLELLLSGVVPILKSAIGPD